MYQYYHVISCEWRITIVNQNTTDGLEMVLATMYESSGTSADGITYPDAATFKHAQFFPKLHFHRNTARNATSSSSGVTTISDTYVNGMIERAVINDTDAETWTKVGSNPTLTENLALLAWLDPMSANGSPTPKCNVEIQMRFKVQYKDVFNQIRFPYDAATAINIALPVDLTSYTG